MAKHAVLSASSSPRWLKCAAAPMMERGRPDASSDAADDGTATHYLASECLIMGLDAADVLGAMIVIDENGSAVWCREGDPVFSARNAMDKVLPVNVERCERAQMYIDHVRDLVAGDEHAQLFVEESVPIGSITGEEGAEGTADALVFNPTYHTLHVCDLKDGYNYVDASTPQLRLYALGALEKYGDLYDDIELVVCWIIQPRTGEPRKVEYDVDMLRFFGAVMQDRARSCLDTLKYPDEVAPEDFAPSEDTCKYCKAKGDCAARASSALGAMVGEFQNLDDAIAAIPDSAARPLTLSTDQLDALFPLLDHVANWAKDVRGEIDWRALTGEHTFTTCKVVAGKKGNRAWADEVQAEEMLKTMRLKHDQMYQYKVITPTTAEKLAKTGDIGPRQWPKLQSLITQKDGAPTVVSIDDKRPALEVKPIASEFKSLDDDLSGLD